MTNARANGIRTFECIVNVTVPLEGELSDWPNHIQDAIYAAMEAKAAEVGLPLALVHSGCEVDVDTGPYLRIILSEVVADVAGAVPKGGEFFIANPPANLN